MSLQSRILSPYDLFAGKICAALDRQHPRDLFDVHLLLKSEGLKPEIRRAFIVYLVSHPRPMVEILSPQKKEMRDIFEKEFKGMIAEDIPFKALETTRNDLVEILREELTPVKGEGRNRRIGEAENRRGGRNNSVRRLSRWQRESQAIRIYGFIRLQWKRP
ncbi:MAG: nucleotidyl transferase AbiEii/AbiGii toxin family protein [Thermodesulfobacteriota bacterium]